jgi:outer membrane protein
MSILKSKKRTLFINLSLISVISALSLQANASDAVGPGDSDSKWVLGAVSGISKNPYSGEGSESWISPTIRYNGERFFIKDASLNLHIAKSNNFSGGVKVTVDGGFLSDSSDFNDNEKLAGLKERDATLLGGFYVNHDSDYGRLSFSALTDLDNEHDGQVATLKYTFDLKAGDWNINPVVGLQWASDEVVNYYAGVGASESTATRAQYSGSDAFNAFAGMRARYEITDNWDVNLKAGFSKLGSDLTDSPILEDDFISSASIGINYNF